MPAPGRWPASTGVLAQFCGAAVTTVVVVVLGGTRHQDAALAAFAALTVVVAARTAPLAAPGMGIIAWMFDNGFLVNRHAHLVWHGTADGIRLGVLLGAAVCGAALGWAVRSSGSRVSPGPAEAARGTRRGIVVDLGEIRVRRGAGRSRDEGTGAAGTADD